MKIHVGVFVCLMLVAPLGCSSESKRDLENGKKYIFEKDIFGKGPPPSPPKFLSKKSNGEDLYKFISGVGGDGEAMTIDEEYSLSKAIGYYSRIDYHRLKAGYEIKKDPATRSQRAIANMDLLNWRRTDLGEWLSDVHGYKSLNEDEFFRNCVKWVGGPECDKRLSTFEVGETLLQKLAEIGWNKMTINEREDRFGKTATKLIQSHIGEWGAMLCAVVLIEAAFPSMSTAEYRKLHKVGAGYDVDHMLAKSHGGVDTEFNYQVLPSSTNRGIGNSLSRHFEINPGGMIVGMLVSALKVDIVIIYLGRVIIDIIEYLFGPNVPTCIRAAVVIQVAKERIFADYQTKLSAWEALE